MGTNGTGGFDEFDRTMEELCQSANDLGRALSKKLGGGARSAMDAAARGMRGAADSMGGAQIGRQDAAESPRSAGRVGAYLRSEAFGRTARTAGGAALGALLAAGAALLGLACAVLLAVNALWVHAAALGAGALVTGAAACVCAALSVRSFAALSRAQRLETYRALLAGKSERSLTDLACAVAKPEPFVCWELRALSRAGRLAPAVLSEDGSVLYASAASAPRTQPRSAPQRGGDARPGADTLARCAAFADALAVRKRSIASADVREQTDQLEARTRALTLWLQKHPESESAVRRFAGYYLPTILKLLDSYAEVSAQGGSAADDMTGEISGVLRTVNQALRTLQESLVQNTALDVSAEISAMETVLSQDGYAPQNDFAPAQTAQQEEKL